MIGLVCDQVIWKGRARAAAPSVIPAARIWRKPLLPQVLLKSPTNSRPAGRGDAAVG